MEKLHHVKRHECGMLEYTSYTWDFQYAIRTSGVNSSCSPLPSFVFGIKIPPSQKSQILYDTVEIALSKMQSAKAASSADELPWLRKRQWHVSFAPTGSIENKTSASHNASSAWINKSGHQNILSRLSVVVQQIHLFYRFPNHFIWHWRALNYG